MSPERPQSSIEYKPDYLRCPIEVVADALLEADLPHENFAWLGQVLDGELPGQNADYNIALLKRASFNTPPVGDTEVMIKAHIAQALGLLQAQHRADIETATQELNGFIDARQGVFVVEETGGVVISLTFQQNTTRTIAVELNTTQGPVVVDRGAQVRVDIDRLSPEEQAAVRAYNGQ